MLYKIYIPKNKVLQKFIQYFWIVKHNLNGSRISNPVLIPENFFDIILNFGSPYQWKDKQNNTILIKGSHLVGIRNKPFTIEHFGNIDFVAIRFYPNGLYPFIKIPLSELTCKPFNLQDVIGVFANELENRIYDLKSDDDKINQLEKTLLEIIDFKYANNPFVEYSINLIHKTKGQIQINDICKQLKINDKYLQRKFAEFVGVSPKFYSQIIRFNHIINILNNTKIHDWSSITYNCGYFDQSHFIKEFERFSGETPQNYYHKRNTISDVYN